MEVDLTTSFESVGGSDSHIMCLREMVVLPLLYPEIFSKFKIAPPRGGSKIDLNTSQDAFRVLLNRFHSLSFC
jgi:hypothetical protein